VSISSAVAIDPGRRRSLGPGVGAPRPALVAWARTLAWVTVGYNLLEGLVSMGFGVSDESVALFGFGADSFIEVGSALLVLWRFRREAACRTEDAALRERRATAGIGWLFLALAVGTAAGATLQLVGHGHPETTVPGLVIALASIAFMLWLWHEKRLAAAALASRTLAGDAACSLVCVKLSLVLLAGSVVFLLAPALWWADAVAAIGLAVMIAREGWEMLQASRRPGGDATCGCHD
jgi:divalent metal cation (Fe/Co/Zn/Cd) transporter